MDRTRRAGCAHRCPRARAHRGDLGRREQLGRPVPTVHPVQHVTGQRILGAQPTQQEPQRAPRLVERQTLRRHYRLRGLAPPPPARPGGPARASARRSSTYDTSNLPVRHPRTSPPTAATPSRHAILLATDHVSRNRGPPVLRRGPRRLPPRRAYGWVPRDFASSRHLRRCGDPASARGARRAASAAMRTSSPRRGCRARSPSRCGRGQARGRVARIRSPLPGQRPVRYRCRPWSRDRAR
jgi:hypothetical protein